MPELSVSYLGDVCVVKLQGRFQQPEIDDFKAKIETVSRTKNINAFIIDCTWLTQIGSGGMKAMCVTRNYLTARGQRFFVTGLRANVRETFRLSGMDAILHLCESDDKAYRMVEEKTS